MKINANVNANRANGHERTQRADKAQPTSKALNANRTQSAQKANKAQNTVFNKVEINAQELFKTMTVNGTDKGSKSGQPDFVEQLDKKIKKLMNAYKNSLKLQTAEQESWIFRLSNRMETDSSRPLDNFVDNLAKSNPRITKAINQDGGVRINFNPMTNPSLSAYFSRATNPLLSAYKTAQNDYESQEAEVNELA